MSLRPGQVRSLASTSAAPFLLVDDHESSAASAAGRAQQQHLIHVLDQLPDAAAESQEPPVFSDA